MTCSPARLAANIANAQKSTGPKTEEGKTRSRANSYKHGLTGRGIVLPSEDVIEIEARFEDFQADMRPRNSVARFLIRQAAMLSVRLDRCARHDSSMTSDRVRKAVTDFDASRIDESNRLYDWITADPAANARKLHGTPEGVDRMIRALLGLKEDLEHETRVRWDWMHLEKLENLMGRRLSDFPISRAKALSDAVGGNFKFLEADDAPDLDGDDRQTWAREQLGEVIDAEIERSQALMEEFDFDEIARERAESVDRVLFDPGKEATLARKYEAANNRAFFRTMDEFDKRNAVEIAPENENELPVSPTSEPEFEESLGSSLPEDKEREPLPVEPFPQPTSDTKTRSNRRSKGASPSPDIGPR